MTTTSRANLRDQVISELRGIGSDFGGAVVCCRHQGIPSWSPGSYTSISTWKYLPIPGTSSTSGKTASSAGSPVVPRWIRAIRPEIRPVSSEEDGGRVPVRQLALGTSPVSQGYNHRTWFLILDEANGELIRILALGRETLNREARLSRSLQQ